MKGFRCGLALAALSLSGLAAAEEPRVIHNRVGITLDPLTHTITVRDTVPLAPHSCWLAETLHVTRFGDLDPFFAMGKELLAPVDTLDFAPENTKKVFFTFPNPHSQMPASGIRESFIEYTGTFHQSTEDATFSRENVGGEIEATISEEGIYLSAGACWLPFFGEGVMATHHLTIDTPLGWEPVTQGVRTRHEEKDGRLITIWEARHPSDGLNLVVAPFVVTEEMHGDVSIYTFLLSDDRRLSDLYLERTRAYLDLYEELIGPYPYGKFATVENWFPTGYGMPSYTLLGGMVMRLPFIPYTSFGHEICHNWWGNSVFVGEGGNWCEGLTVYCADYLYKQQESAAAAREYRRNLLKDYAAYVATEGPAGEGSPGETGRDFPLTEFKSRHSGATRAVGYGKSMMVFHMVDREIGRESFLAGLRSVYREKRFRQATWGDFFAAFALASGRDLTGFQQQWLTRTGVPTLTLAGVELVGDAVALRLEQGTPTYELQIPVVVVTPAGPVEHTVRLAEKSRTFTLEAPGATAVAVDPDHHLFRRLHRQEIEPTISQVLAEEVPLFVLPAGQEAEVEAAREFALSFGHSDDPIFFENGQPPTDVTPGTALCGVLLNPPPGVLQEWRPAELTIAGDTVLLAGKRYSLREYNLVFAVYNPHDPTATDLVLVCRQFATLPSLARRIGHYGKYSWLLLPVGGGESFKGNWQPAGNPLQVQIPFPGN